MSSSPRDENRVPGLIAKSDADNTPVVVEADPTTKRLKTNTTVTGDVNVTATDLDIRNLAFATDKVDVSGSDINTTVAEEDVFHNIMVGNRYNQIEVDYSILDPDANTDITVTKVSTGDASNVTGHARFETGTGTSGSIKSVSVLNLDYRPAYEVYVDFTVAFTTGIASSFQRLGLYGTTDGFFIGYEGTSFGITSRFNSVDTTVAQASFNVDTLVGGASSNFTRNGTPEALDVTKKNLYRIRFGWLGIAPVIFEVFSPDGEWVEFHKLRYPNSQTVSSLTTTVLPVTLHASKTTAGATNLIMFTSCWAAGTTSELQTVTSTITDKTLIKPIRSVIAGHTTAGGGDYVNVKVNPSGALTVAATLDAETTKNIGTVRVGDGTDTLLITAAGEANVLESNSAAIKTAVETIDNAISGSEMQVDVITSALPSGAATSAAQTTAQTSLSSIDTKLSSAGTETTLSAVSNKLPDFSGTWGYAA